MSKLGGPKQRVGAATRQPISLSGPKKINVDVLVDIVEESLAKLDLKELRALNRLLYVSEPLDPKHGKHQLEWLTLKLIAKRTGGKL